MYEVTDMKGYAMKVFNPVRISKEEAVRFRKEIALVTLSESNCKVYSLNFSLMKHPNLIPCLGSDMANENNMAYLMPYYSVGSLKHVLLNMPQQITLKLLTEIVIDICKGLEFMHSWSVFHRDLKPDNVMVNKLTLLTFFKSFYPSN